MEKLDNSDGKIYLIKTNIYHFSPLYESDNEEITNHRTKSKITIIVLSDKEKGSKNKGGQSKGNE